MNKLIIVGGLTATGKTKLAIDIAKKFNGELINADSRQIYKYLNIGTNKEYPDVPTHLLDLINPDQRFSVFEYQQAAFKAIDEIIGRGKVPILVGGTGLYIDSVIKNYSLSDKNDENLRSELNSKTLEELQKELNQIDPEILNQLNDSDKNNPRRLIRLIEKSGNKNGNTDPKYETLFLYPEYNWEGLKIKIENRVDWMFGRNTKSRITNYELNKGQNIVDETKKILEMGYKDSDPGLQIMGYSQIIRALNGEFDLEKAIELVKFAHKQYAKRQRTWFEGKNRNYNLVRINSTEEALSKVSDFLN